MDIEDILDEINYLKKKTLLLEKCMNKKYTNEILDTNEKSSELKKKTQHPIIIKKRTIC